MAKENDVLYLLLGLGWPLRLLQWRALEGFHVHIIKELPVRPVWQITADAHLLIDGVLLQPARLARM